LHREGAGAGGKEAGRGHRRRHRSRAGHHRGSEEGLRERRARPAALPARLPAGRAVRAVQEIRVRWVEHEHRRRRGHSEDHRRIDAAHREGDPLTQASSTSGIEKAPFGTTRDGAPVELYTLHNAAGSSVAIATYGATVVSLRMPDRDGHLDDVVLGYDGLEGYLGSRSEEHTSELQSRENLVCRLLLEKK